MVQLHRQVGRLEVEGDHLTAGVPEDLRKEVARLGAGALRVDAAELTLVVVDELDRLRLEQVQRGRLGEARHVIVFVRLLRVLEAAELHRLRVVHLQELGERKSFQVNRGGQVRGARYE